MNAPKFTPGPWRLDADSHIRATNDDRHTTIALIPPTFHSADIWDANAHLIAAAPELYEALEEFVFLASKPIVDSDIRHAAFVKAKTALAKARGESHD